MPKRKYKRYCVWSQGTIASSITYNGVYDRKYEKKLNEDRAGITSQEQAKREAEILNNEMENCRNY